MSTILSRPETQLAALGAYGLAGSVLEPERGPFEPHEWFELLHACRAQGLVALLAAAGQRGDVALSAEQAEELAGVERDAAAVALFAEQRVLQASAVLAAADVDHRVLGGPPRARLGYRDPAVRLFHTATLLVPPAAVGLGRGLIRGIHRPRIAVRPAVDLGDVHLEMAQLTDPAALLALADRPIPTASVEEHLLFACLEVATVTDVNPDGDARLVVLRDVAELVLSPGVDADRVRQIAQAWGVVDLVARSIAETWFQFGLADRTALSVWAAREEQLRPRRQARGRIGRRSKT